jgi:allantoate deiminase
MSGREIRPALITNMEVDVSDVARSVARRLRELSSIGRDPAGGWSRIAFTESERQAHALFASWAGELGLQTGQDAIGNSYAKHPGKGKQLMMGSHLDSVPKGGNFDGAAGIVAAIEAAAILLRDHLTHPLTVVCFSCEEGARFTAPCLGSRAITGHIDASGLQALQDGNGVNAHDAARDCGLEVDRLNEDVWPGSSVAVYIELHIEQGRVLQEAGRRIGVVDTIAGSTRIEVSLVGRSDHSGTTPMALRHDPLIGAAEVISKVEQAARRSRTAVATVGRIQVSPNVVTTIPRDVRFTVDVRDIDPLRQREVAGEVLAAVQRSANQRGLRASARLLHDQSPFILHHWVREQLAAVADDLQVSYRVMPSGAGHDAGYVSLVAPAGMLFVPSRDGISHAPEEWSESEDIALGAAVLASALRRIDEALDVGTNKDGASA